MAKSRVPGTGLSWRLGLLHALALAGCSQGLDGITPALEAPGEAETAPVDPGIVCAEQLDTELTVRGSGFSPMPIDIPDAPKTALPDIRLTRASELDGDALDGDATPQEVIWSGNPDRSPDNTHDEDDVPLLAWDSREQMRFRVNQELVLSRTRTADGEDDVKTGELEAGIYDVSVDNPNGKRATSPGALAVVERPSVDALTPTLTCLDQGARSFTLDGENLLELEGEAPAFEVEGVDEAFETDLSDCNDIAHEGLSAALCETAEVELAEGAVPVGLASVVVRNPEPAACFTTDELALRVVPAPTIEAVTPSPVCVEDIDLPIMVEGAGFLGVDGSTPRVTIDDDLVEVVALDGCEDLETPGLDVESCTRIDLGTIVADIGTGLHDVAVENPDPAGCDDRVSGVLRVLPPPTLTGLGTPEICSDQMQTLVLTGTDFAEGARVRVGEYEASSVALVDDATLEATFEEGVPAGTYDVTVQTGVSGCIATLTAGLAVNPSPLVFFVDPPVVYNGITLNATLFTSGLTSKASTVEMIDSDGDVTELTDFDSPLRPNRIQATIEAGLPPGDYELRVTSNIGCSGTLPGGLTVTDSLTLDLEAIDPSFVSPTGATAVTITAGTSGFVSTPRVYLNPEGGGDATALQAVLFQDAGTLTAVVPAGLDPDDYSLIVVNPDGAVGVLDASAVQALTVTGGEPPVIDSVVPASLQAGGSDTLTLSGAGFDTSGASVELDCRLPGGTTRVTVPGTGLSVAGGGTGATVTVDLGNGSPSDPGQGSVCLVKLTNADGAFFAFSAFSVTNSSFNLAPWSDGSDMVSPRRALSLVAGRPTGTSRFLYAIGGDSGGAGALTMGTVESTVEAAGVDVFGNLGSWSTQRNALPAARTLAGAATIGRFVYLVGGHDGSSATSTLQRAQILDPLAAPEILDLDATLGEGEGLGGGLWLYRVAATFADADVSNPGGEGLPGEVLSVQLPDRDEGILLTLSWPAVTGADGYHIYRSPAAGDGVDALQLLAEIDGGSTLSHTDDGSATSGSGPLPTGALGVWHAVDGARCSSGDCLLGTAREGHAVVSVADPASAGTVYLYAFGGRDDTGTYLDSYEVAAVTIGGDGSQTVGDFSSGAGTLPTPRADMGFWVMDARSSSEIRSSASPTDVWVFVGGGRTTGGAADRGIAAGLLGASGDLGTLMATDDLKGDLVGFGTGYSNDQLYTFGGTGSANGTSGALIDYASLPDLQNSSFNSLGNAATDRQFMGSTQESAFFFLAGGHDGTATLTSTEQTVQ